ncbi:MAG: hypothetical protein QNJ81_12705 [Acidimicrobiia bacterium]|nr:hypothetical protein [Acidimicrobiia bacterium]
MMACAVSLFEAMGGNSLARFVAAAVALVLISAACSSTSSTTTSTSTSTTTTTLDPVVAERAADVQLINDLWWGERLAFQVGFDEGVRYWVNNNYPQMECTYSDYIRSWFPAGPVEGLTVERLTNTPSIARDDGWVIPGGRLQGQVAEGRVYVMSVEVTRVDPRSAPEPAVTRNLHVTILDGEAHFFIGCPS